MQVEVTASPGTCNVGNWKTRVHASRVTDKLGRRQAGLVTNPGAGKPSYWQTRVQAKSVESKVRLNDWHMTFTDNDHSASTQH